MTNYDTDENEILIDINNHLNNDLAKLKKLDIQNKCSVDFISKIDLECKENYTSKSKTK